MLDKTSLEILEFIDKNASVSDNQLKINFSTHNVFMFVNSLLKIGCISGTQTPFITKSYYTNEIKEHISTVGPYETTPLGKAYLEDYAESKKKYKINRIHEWINTMIAAIAMIAAIVGLFN